MIVGVQLFRERIDPPSDQVAYDLSPRVILTALSGWRRGPCFHDGDEFSSRDGPDSVGWLDILYHCTIFESRSQADFGVGSARQLFVIFFCHSPPPRPSKTRTNRTTLKMSQSRAQPRKKFFDVGENYDVLEVVHEGTCVVVRSALHKPTSAKVAI